MGCCAYVPKFPAWNLPIKIWKWSHALGRCARQLPDITGQIQAQEQSADEGGRCTAYMRYPKEHDRLRDVFDYGHGADASPWDVVSFALPGGREVYYYVRECQGTSTGFPNAHLSCTLAKLTSLETIDVLPPYPPVEPDPPSLVTSSLVAYPVSVANDGIETTESTLTLRYADGSPVIGAVVPITSTGSVSVTGSPVTTDAMGVGVISATNTIEEITHFTATTVAGDIDSNFVDWSTSPTPPCEGIPSSLTVGTVGGNTCDGGLCGALAGVWPMSSHLTAYRSDDEFALCGGYDHLQWYASCHPDGYWTVRLSDPVMGTTVVYAGDIGAGIGSGLVLTMSDASPLCTFPSTVLLLP